MLLILIILFATIFFCQGLIRLCLLIFRPKPTEERRRSRLPQMYGPGGYAVPRQPIRVVLARDEEAAGIESDATKMNPPAYGLWRESVVSTVPVPNSPCRCDGATNKGYVVAYGLTCFPTVASRPEPHLLAAQHRSTPAYHRGA